MTTEHASPARLREIAEHTDRRNDMREALREAADEIERLHEAIGVALSVMEGDGLCICTDVKQMLRVAYDRHR